MTGQLGFRDTICALASGLPPSAIAIIRISGPAVQAFAERHLSAGLPPPRLATLTRIEDSSGNTLDQAVALYFPGPKSYTGEDILELNLHGGPAVIDAVLSTLLATQGVRLAEAGEFTRRAFEAGKIDLTEAEAVADLIAADTAGQRSLALDQLGGSLSVAYETWRKKLIAILALIEVAIDFPDEADAPDYTDAPVLAQIEALTADLAAALNDDGIGERIRDGFRIALIGAPNAGKSSLLNRLAGRDAAIVTDVPGTTRDPIEVQLSLAGQRVWIVDTAGLRQSNDAIEAAGMDRAKRAAAEADLTVLVVDKREGTVPAEVDAKDIELVVLNKSDLDGQAASLSPDVSRETLALSARTGDGIDGLVAALSERIKRRVAVAPAPLITRHRHRVGLSTAQQHLGAAASALTNRLGPEFAAEDLRRAITELSALMGDIDVEEVLSAVFSEFCIGK